MTQPRLPRGHRSSSEAPGLERNFRTQGCPSGLLCAKHPPHPPPCGMSLSPATEKVRGGLVATWSLPRSPEPPPLMGRSQDPGQPPPLSSHSPVASPRDRDHHLKTYKSVLPGSKLVDWLLAQVRTWWPSLVVCSAWAEVLPGARICGVLFWFAWFFR